MALQTGFMDRLGGDGGGGAGAAHLVCSLSPALLYSDVVLAGRRLCGNTMVEQLFGSKTRVKLLSLFFNNPGRPFYVREITRKIDEQINSVRRELANLLSVGLV